MPYLVYKFTNQKNGKAYIGFTSKSVKERWWSHSSKARKNSTDCRKFYSALRKYGEDCWGTEILFVSDDSQEALKFETQAILEHDTIENGYNICQGGEKGNLGLKMSDETCRKISERQCGENNPCWKKNYTNEERSAQSKKMKKWHAENPHPLLGKKASVETRTKMSVIRIGEKNHFYGKKHTPKQIEKFSKNNPMVGFWGWKNPCTRKNLRAMEIYSRADEFYKWWKDHKSAGPDRLANAFKEKRSKPHFTMIDKFRSGWIPSADKEWLDEFRK
jgi:group I intron endonuclease